MPKAFDLIADMLIDPRFDETDLKSEQRVIIEEMKMIEDSPEEYLGEIFSEAFFPEHQLGLNIAGTPNTVRSFNKEITRKYHAENYTAASLVIAAAGNITHERVLELTSEYFDFARSGVPPSSLTPPDVAAPIIVKNNSNLEQAHFIVATPFVSGADERRYAADLLANIVGGGTSSRLWQKVASSAAWRTMSDFDRYVSGLRTVLDLCRNVARTGGRSRRSGSC